MSIYVNNVILVIGPSYLNHKIGNLSKLHSKTAKLGQSIEV